MYLNARDIPDQPWVAQIFSSKSARGGGVVRRSLRDVEREIGYGRLELGVRRRGYHMVQSGDQIVIFCTSEPLRIIC